ncbi:DNA glycosylase [Hypoxylon fragiforme]|uniref:DNA glycosylase n=1 Tax=Hypoxylon fragiforme TaxID=63214 RepID=UPI0020C651C0|nr:DNA glycosylase [Hypoxylon fragiforme]KAI2603921.1 DNA glycosylase [Hypoxylon fragiforme]
MATSNNEQVAQTEASFEGRLQLKNFMFAGAPSQNTPSPEPRRSQRLLVPQPTASPPPPTSSSSPKPSRKRKTGSKVRATESESNFFSNSNSNSNSTPPQKRPRRSTSYAPPSTYAHLPTLPDALAPNLLILTIGLNPGLQTARTGHAYAHPSNLYWKLLHSSGITTAPAPCRATEDQEMPRRYGIGHTNIVARPSRNGAELSKGEMDAGVADLDRKCRRWKPEVACVVGKSIWESVFRVRHGRALRKGEFVYGWQDEGERMGAGVEEGKGGDFKKEGEEDGEGGKEGKEKEKEWKGSRIFVAPSTSGLAATLRPEEKERIWKILGDWCVARRKEREVEAEVESTATVEGTVDQDAS